MATAPSATYPARRSALVALPNHAATRVDTVAIPDRQNAVTDYLVAEPAAVDDRAGADAFIDFLTSSAGQRVLRRYGFLAP